MNIQVACTQLTMMKARCLSALSILLMLFAAVSCNTTKFVPEGSYLLDNVSIRSDSREVPKDELSDYLRQTPNGSVFGLFRMQLGIYNLAGRDSSKWYNRTLMRMGQAPVIYDPTLTSISRQQLQLALQNKGFLRARVETHTDNPASKKAVVHYLIRANKPYRIRNYTSSLSDSLLASIATDTVRSLIKSGARFDTDLLERERERIAKRFRQMGYYNFQKDFIAFEADSSLNSSRIDLKIDLHDELKESPQHIRELVFRPYRFRNVYYKINREFDLGYSNARDSLKTDTLRHDGYHLAAAEENFLRLKTLIRNTHIVPGTSYSDAALERSYSSLNALPPVKYVNINFERVKDSLLDCHIHMVPAKSIAFSTEAEVTYTEGYWGLGSGISTQHRNLFDGAEMLTLQARMAVEKQETLWAKELGGQMGLLFPNFLIPFLPEAIKRRVRAKTELSFSLSYQLRPQEYTMNNVGAGIKYLWNFREFKHSLELLDVSRVYFPHISDNFRDLYLNSGIYNRYNYDNHLIMRVGYSGAKSNYNPARPLRNYSTFQFGVETAGNILYSLASLMKWQRDDHGAYKIFNVRFAQYIKADFNLTYHQIFDKNNRFVYRAGIGLASPYGNAEVIPYERRFFSGGANSVRGWSESALGPGVYRKRSPRGRRDYNQTGDIKLDLNMEYRAKLFWLLEGAFFIDAGNIWTIRNYSEQPGGLFAFNTFMEQIAFAYGFGLRADFSFFILRVDLGAKLYDPNLERSQRFRISPNGGDFALHFAIGYPF